MDEDDELNDLLNDINNFDTQNNFFTRQQLDVGRKYRIRPRLNPIAYFDEEEFERRFRFSKNEVEEIYNLINGQQTLEPLVCILSLF